MAARIRCFLALLSLVFFSTNCLAAGNADEVRALYSRFYTAQNARNLDEVKAQFLDSPDFLWVSDGKSFWSREATLERMKMFQVNEVWRVEPDLKNAKVIEVSDTVAYLHLTLDLFIGSTAKPDRIGFLVSALCVKTAQGWKIAALFTTTAKPA